ncbi:DNA-directed RNA polymerase RPB5 subunit, eukaryote/virus [Heracleum sosnowskyi]|uniref:DNA-directed RNA polymerase RPB5 subunit, eukaryote/virus n=1 Tax=Heracleum sosnowskyi TaxID=360622 RepID=A0AAD8I3L9_9APIA|nr:DNA-directed RNA polymerase RPB5 subunit, eukaryote/virus [Heracleum sosnowskyi]
MARAGLGYGVEASESSKHCVAKFIDTGSVETHRLYLARRTVLEMLKDRGYGVDETDIDMSLAEFRTRFGEVASQGLLDRLRFSVSRISQPSQKVLVVFCGTDEIRKQAMSTLLFQLSHDSSRPRILLVLQSKMNSHAQKLAAESSFQIETFPITDLLVNFTKHQLLPKHEILSAEEQQSLLKKLNVQPSQMPRMLETDPIVKYYGLEKGQILKVTFHGPSTAALVTYRCIM